MHENKFNFTYIAGACPKKDIEAGDGSAAQVLWAAPEGAGAV